MSRQLIRLKTRQNMIKKTLPTLTFPPNQIINKSPLVGIGKLKKRVRPPHSRGGGDAGGTEAAAVAANISKEAATVDWSRVGCAGSGGRPR